MWNTAFDKVFADLRARHPADEWTLRLVGNSKEKAEVVPDASLPASPEEELMMLEQLGVTIVTENEGVAQAEAVELSHCPPPGEEEQAEADGRGDGGTEVNNDEPVDQLVTVGNLQSTEPTGTDDPDSNAPIPANDNEPQPIVNCLPADEPAEEVVENVIVQEQASAPVEATPEAQNAEDVTLDSAAQEPEKLVTNEEQPEEAKQQETEAEASQQDEAQSNEKLAAEEQQEPQPEVNGDDSVTNDDVEDFVKVEAECANQVESAQVETVPADDEQQTATAPEAVGEAEQTETSNDHSANVPADGEQENALGLGAINHDGSPAVEASEPPKPAEEVEPAPIQQQQSTSTSASSPNLAASSSPVSNPAKKGTLPVSSTSTGKKRSHNAMQQPANADGGSRKPEWMRRPLVRKGSVGRFLGRMKETMQSKRFGPDRLPVVPPPEPEPPKRPPRRKTLANLDLNRESVTTSREQSQLDSPSPPSPPPPTPRSPPAENSVDNRSVSNKSATLRSTTSERKRRNSVGRLAASAASRISRALSIKHLNHADGQQATAAEAAPLLQQEGPVADPPSPPPAQQPPPSPSPDKSIRKDFVQLMHRMDPRHVLDRILTPKTPSAEEAKSKPALPERPPPPAAPVVAAKAPRVKPIVKNGKVHFECQVR